MKKNVLALSITAALIGLTGGAQAMTNTGGATATGLALNGDGIGHMLLVPYFSAQENNATLINLTNTDMVNGKAVKIRFRGAANSDDLFDFQVFLSPGDVFAAKVSRGADGIAVLTVDTPDTSCTKPAKAVLSGGKFGTLRLDSTMTDAQKANGTREGYVEIFNMGDIPKALGGTGNNAAVGGGTANTLADDTTASAGIDTTAGASVNPLYTAIKHVSKVAPCTGAAWTALDTNNLTYSATVSDANTPRSRGLVPPTTGLMANWTIVNIANAAAWSGEAVAIQGTGGAAGNVVYWPQTGVSVGAAGAADIFTADPLLRSTNVYKWNTTTALYEPVIVPAVNALYVDLPDMSTPYVSATTPLTQAKILTASIAATSAINEFLTNTSIVASTDWVFSMPTRRYSTAFNYGATIAASDDGRRFTELNGTSGTQTAVAGTLVTNFATTYFDRTNTLVAQSAATNGNGRQICVSKSTMTTTVTDREESATPTAVVISPAPVSAALVFCGEAAVLSINNGGILATGTSSLKASVAVQDLDVTYRDGWMTIATPAAGVNNGLPVVGAAFSRAFANATTSFGATYKHRFGRTAP